MLTFPAPSTIPAFVAIALDRPAVACRHYYDGATIEIHGVPVTPSLATCRAAVVAFRQGRGDLEIAVTRDDILNAVRREARRAYVEACADEFAPIRKAGRCDVCRCPDTVQGYMHQAPDANLWATEVLFVGDCCPGALPGGAS